MASSPLIFQAMPPPAARRRPAQFTLPSVLNVEKRLAECPLLCWFLDAGNDETLGRLSWPASKKRQGTKSREVGRRRCSELPDLAAPKILCDRLVA
jgi:hypothetical protein